MKTRYCARAATVALLTIGIPLFGWAADKDNETDLAAANRYQPPTYGLVQKVYHNTKQFKDINAAFADHWFQATPCVSGPQSGAMGVHFFNNDNRQKDAIIDVRFPEALIYEPLPGTNRWMFVGVEFIVDAGLWAEAHPEGGTPSVEGNLMNLVDEPNRYGLGPFYELHVWAFQQNPNGAFADWNSRVNCENAQPLPVT
jgi:hypothetical protein